MDEICQLIEIVFSTLDEQVLTSAIKKRQSKIIDYCLKSGLRFSPENVEIIMSLRPEYAKLIDSNYQFKYDHIVSTILYSRDEYVIDKLLSKCTTGIDIKHALQSSIQANNLVAFERLKEHFDRYYSSGMRVPADIVKIFIKDKNTEALLSILNSSEEHAKLIIPHLPNQEAIQLFDNMEMSSFDYVRLLLKHPAITKTMIRVLIADSNTSDTIKLFLEDYLSTK